MTSIYERSRVLLLGSVLLIATILAACGDATNAVAPRAEAGGVSIVADKGSYRPGDEVKVTLRNYSQGEVGYNLCFAFLKLQRQIDQRWETQTGADLGPPGSGLTECTAPLYLLAAGDTAKGSAHVPQDVVPGTYRLAHHVEIGTERSEIATDTFEVTT